MKAPRPTGGEPTAVASLPAGDRCAARGRVGQPARAPVRSRLRRWPGGRSRPTRPRRWARSASAWRWSASATRSCPTLPGTERWEEPDEPRHPLTGNRARARHGGRAGAGLRRGHAVRDRRRLPHAVGRGRELGSGGGGDGRRRPPADVGAVRARRRSTLLRAARRRTRRSRATVEALDPVRVALPARAGAQRQHPRGPRRGRGAARPSGSRPRSAPTARSWWGGAAGVLLAPGERAGRQLGAGAEAVARGLAREREAVEVGTRAAADRDRVAARSGSSRPSSLPAAMRARTSARSRPRAGLRPSAAAVEAWRPPPAWMRARWHG